MISTLYFLDIQVKENAPEMLMEIKSLNDAPEVVLLTGHATNRSGIEAIKKGSMEIGVKTYLD